MPLLTPTSQPPLGAPWSQTQSSTRLEASSLAVLPQSDPLDALQAASASEMSVTSSVAAYGSITVASGLTSRRNLNTRTGSGSAAPWTVICTGRTATGGAANIGMWTIWKLSLAVHSAVSHGLSFCVVPPVARKPVPIESSLLVQSGGSVNV